MLDEDDYIPDGPEWIRIEAVPDDPYGPVWQKPFRVIIRERSSSVTTVRGVSSLEQARDEAAIYAGSKTRIIEPEEVKC